MGTDNYIIIMIIIIRTCSVFNNFISNLKLIALSSTNNFVALSLIKSD